MIIHIKNNAQQATNHRLTTFHKKLIQSHRREIVLFTQSDIDAEASSLFVTYLIKKIMRYNQIPNEYVKIKIKNIRRSTRTGIFINSANHAHTHKILGLYFDSICDFFEVVSIQRASSSKISSGSQIEFTIFTNFF